MSFWIKLFPGKIIKKYQHISWHLSAKLKALAIFDNSVPIQEKRRMLLAMNTVYGDDEPAKRIQTDSETLHKKDLLHLTKTP